MAYPEVEHHAGRVEWQTGLFDLCSVQQAVQVLVCPCYVFGQVVDAGTENEYGFVPNIRPACICYGCMYLAAVASCQAIALTIALTVVNPWNIVVSTIVGSCLYGWTAGSMAAYSTVSTREQLGLPRWSSKDVQDGCWFSWCVMARNQRELQSVRQNGGREQLATMFPPQYHNHMPMYTMRNSASNKTSVCFY